MTPPAIDPGVAADRLSMVALVEGMQADRLFSSVEIADALGINRNTVRSHFHSYADIFTADPGTGPRGRRVYSHNAIRRYALFHTLRGDETRLTANEAIFLIRGGDLNTLWDYIRGPVEPLMRHVRSLLTASSRTAA